MANRAHFFKRSQELRYVKDLMMGLDQEINRFDRVARKYIDQKAAIELDSAKMEEVLRDIEVLKRFVLKRKEELKRMSKIKVKHWEQSHLSGQAGDIRGYRRMINRKLNRLLDRLQRLQSNISSHKFSDRALVIEQMAKQFDNLIDKNSRDAKFNAGGDLIMAITLLLAFFIEMSRRRKDD